jgi:hypothetical protein
MHVEHSYYNYVKHLASYYRNVYRKAFPKCPFPIDRQYPNPLYVFHEIENINKAIQTEFVEMEGRGSI